MTKVYIVRQNNEIIAVYSSKTKAIARLYKQFDLLQIVPEIKKNQCNEILKNKHTFITNRLDNNNNSDYSVIMDILKKSVL